MQNFVGEIHCIMRKVKVANGLFILKVNENLEGHVES